VAYNNKAWNYLCSGKDSLTVVWYAMAIPLLAKAGNTLEMARAWRYTGYANTSLGNYQQSNKDIETALYYYKQLGNQKEIASIYNNSGINYFRLARYEKAFELYMKALPIFEQMNYSPGITNVLLNIGLLYKRLKKYTDALQYQTRVLGMAKSANDKVQIAKTWDHIGSIYAEMGKPDTAMVYYKKSLEMNRVIGDSGSVAYNLANIAITFLEMKKYQPAYTYLVPALAIYEQMGNMQDVSTCINYLGEIYVYLTNDELQAAGIAPSQRYIKAETCMQRSLQLNKQMGDLAGAADVWGNLAIMYERQQKYKQAAEAYKQYASLKDTVFNDGKKEEVARMEMQYGFDKKEADIKAEVSKKQILAASKLRQEKTVRNAIIASACLILLAGIVIFTLYKRRRDADQQTKEAEFNAQVSDTEMKALRSQMNPHFIFNSLNSIGESKSSSLVKIRIFRISQLQLCGPFYYKLYMRASLISQYLPMIFIHI